MTDICTLLFELAGHDRLNIMNQLDEEPMVVTKLSKKLGLAATRPAKKEICVGRIFFLEKHLPSLGDRARLPLTHRQLVGQDLLAERRWAGQLP